MTSKLYLDPEQVSELEPSEGDERTRWMLDPIAVPDAISIDFSSEKTIHRIQFLYSGGEAAGATGLLDERTDPKVTVRTSADTQKIMELAFDPAVGADELALIAERLESQADSIPTIAKRLSYRMTARILTNWSTMIRKVSERS